MANLNGKAKILYVDDDLDFLEIFKITFSGWFDITSQENPSEALEMIKNGYFDAVITDYEMPEMNGLELLQKIKEDCPDIPVIFHTGQGNEEVAREAFIKGASDYFTKDIFGFAHKEKLVNSIKKAIEIRNANREKTLSETKYHNYISNAPDGIVVADWDGSFIETNNAVERFTGYGKEDLKKKNVVDFIAPESLGSYMNIIKPLESSQRSSGEIFITRKDGEKRYVAVDAVKVSDSEIIAFCKDLTERKQAEEALIKEKEKAESYLNIAGTIILALDRNLKVTLINAKGCRILGLPNSEIMGKEWFENFVPEKLRAGSVAAFNNVFSGKTEPFKYHENNVITPKGERTIAWYNTYIRNENGEITGTLSSGEDITDRRRAEGKFKNIVERSPLCILEFECKQDFRLTLTGANPAAEKALKIDHKDYLGKRIECLYPALEVSFIEGVYNEIVAGEGSWHSDQLYYKDDRIEGIYDIYAFQSSPGIFVLTFQDITERKKTEMEKMKIISIIENSMDFVGLATLDGKIDYINEAGLKFLGFENLEEAKTKRISEVMPKDFDVEKYFKTFMESGEEYFNAETYLISRTTGKRTDVDLHGYLIKSPQTGEPIFAAVSMKDITEKKKIESTIKSVFETSDTRYGKEFFEIMDTRISEILEADCAFIGRINKDKPAFIKTIALCIDGKIVENIEYSIKGTPCEKIIHDSVFSCKDGVTDLFPDSGFLKRQKIRGYIGIPLIGFNSKPIGVLVALYRNPIKDTKFGESILRIFLPRISSEIEKLKYLDDANEKEEQWQVAAKAGKIGIWYGNVQTGEAHYSRQWKKMLGYNDCEISNSLMEWEKRVHPDERWAVRKEIFRHFKKEIPYFRGEYRFLSKNQGYMWFLASGSVLEWDEKGKPVKFVGAHIDITDRKTSENRLLAINKIFLNLGPDPDENIYLLVKTCGELLGGDFAYYNKLSGGKVVTVSAWNPPDDYVFESNAEGRICSDIIMKGGQGKTFYIKNLEETQYYESDPNIKAYGFKTYFRHPVLHLENIVGGLCVVYRHEVKNSRDHEIIMNILSSAIGLEEERKRFYQELNAKNRELDEFAYKVSHDLKSPINIIKSYAAIIKEDPSLFEDNFHKIEKQANKLLDFIDDILKLSRAGRIIGEKAEVNLENLVKQVFNVNKSPEIVMELKIDSGFPEITGDKEGMEHVFSNLIQNSIKYRDPQKDKLIIEAKFKENEKGVVISIKDNGAGVAIENDDINMIFNPGYSLGRNRGTGFGLAISRKIIDAHGGRMWAESDGEGKGLEVFMELPLNVFSPERQTLVLNASP